MGVELLSGPPGSGKKEYIKEKISAYLKRGEDPSQITVISNSQVASENFHRFLLSETDSSKGIYTESVT
ncbi:MAG: hypothetical protein GX817_02000, partial [Elusimicrobia bacterium]|nr:hypothetical protein [Elusimicrobiota bacterium]